MEGDLEPWLYEEVFTQQIELGKVVVSKTAIPELGTLFCKGNGTHFAFGHTRTNRYAHNQTGRNAGSLEKRVEEEEEEEENVQIILYPGEVEPVGDARPFESGIKSISLRDGAA